MKNIRKNFRKYFLIHSQRKKFSKKKSWENSEKKSLKILKIVERIPEKLLKITPGEVLKQPGETSDGTNERVSKYSAGRVPETNFVRW